MTDQEIAERIAAQALEEDYLRELLASLGFEPGEGWTGETIAAIENATAEQRRRAALRTIGMAG
jgi:hypothetical protein